MMIRLIWTDLLHLLFPRLCICCKTPLTDNEEQLCLNCICELPTTRFYTLGNNKVAQLFTGKVPYIHASAWLYYDKGGLVQKLMHQLKYKGNKQLGFWLGYHAAKDLMQTNNQLFQSIDYLIPVPLHPQKEDQRGYNQAEWIAKGISAATQIPVYKEALQRIKESESQTRKSVFDRWKNVHEQFKLTASTPLKQRHILLIDDVITTGSTLEACAQTLLPINDIRISLLGIAVAG